MAGARPFGWLVVAAWLMAATSGLPLPDQKQQQTTASVPSVKEKKQMILDTVEKAKARIDAEANEAIKNLQNDDPITDSPVVTDATMSEAGAPETPKATAADTASEANEPKDQKVNTETKLASVDAKAEKGDSNTPVTTAKKCSDPAMDSVFVEGKSQDLEDQRFQIGGFRGLCDGTYLEIGGLDGVKFSNTWGFNQYRGWKGTLIEASPPSYKRLARNRPDDKTVNKAVCANKQEVHWVEEGIAPVRGIWEFFPDEKVAGNDKKTFKERFYPDFTDQNIGEHSTAVTCEPLRDILAEEQVQYVDLFSLDVEGAEYDILNSIDFKKFSFGAAAIETNMQTEKFKAVLEPLGYRYIETFERSDWYIHPEFEAIYGRTWTPSDPKVEVKSEALNLLEKGDDVFSGPIYTPGIIYPQAAPVH